MTQADAAELQVLECLRGMRSRYAGKFTRVDRQIMPGFMDGSLRLTPLNPRAVSIDITYSGETVWIQAEGFEAETGDATASALGPTWVSDVTYAIADHGLLKLRRRRGSLPYFAFARSAEELDALVSDRAVKVLHAWERW